MELHADTKELEAAYRKMLAENELYREKLRETRQLRVKKVRKVEHAITKRMQRMNGK